MWAAAEATEYASLLYALAHGLEDSSPTVDTRKHEEPMVLLKEAVLALEKARKETGSGKQSHLEVYRHIREAVTGLRTAYLQATRKTKEE